MQWTLLFIRTSSANTLKQLSMSLLLHLHCDSATMTPSWNSVLLQGAVVSDAACQACTDLMVEDRCSLSIRLTVPCGSRDPTDHAQPQSATAIAPTNNHESIQTSGRSRKQCASKHEYIALGVQNKSNCVSGAHSI